MHPNCSSFSALSFSRLSQNKVAGELDQVVHTAAHTPVGSTSSADLLNSSQCTELKTESPPHDEGFPGSTHTTMPHALVGVSSIGRDSQCLLSL